jgi:hypothetical protein
MYEPLKWIIPQVQNEGSTLGSESCGFGTRRERTGDLGDLMPMRRSLWKSVFEWKNVMRDIARVTSCQPLADKSIPGDMESRGILRMRRRVVLFKRELHWHRVRREAAFVQLEPISKARS